MNIKKFLLLCQKELLTITRDRKSFISFIVMSVIITPLLVGGLNLLDQFQKSQLENQEIIIAINNSSGDMELESILKSSSAIKVQSSSNYQDDLSNKIISGYMEIKSVEGKIDAKYVYDQSSNLSVDSLVKVQEIVQSYSILKRSQILEQKGLSEEDLTPLTFSQITLQEVQNKPAQSSLVLFLLPYIILLGLIQGAAQFAIELTAGEKDKNTLATTLSINASRITIGFAKICVILILSLMSLILNILSLVLVFVLAPEGFTGSSNEAMVDGSIAIGVGTILQILIALIPLSFMISALLILIGIYSRNQKEGGLYLLPLILGSVFIGLTAQAFDASTPAYIFAIPLVGHVALIKQILLGTIYPLNFIISALSSIILFAAILYICVNMFKREEVIFRQ
jgi:sodium transport system permease protein